MIMYGIDNIRDLFGHKVSFILFALFIPTSFIFSKRVALCILWNTIAIMERIFLILYLLIRPVCGSLPIGLYL